MRKTLLIASREYHAMVRTKAFLVTILLMPILMFGALIAQKALRGRVDVTPKTLVVLDGTGVLFEDLASRVEAANEKEIYDRQTGRQVYPRLKLEPGPAGPITDDARFALSEQVRKGQIVGFAELDPIVLEGSPDPLQSGAVFFSESLALNDMLRRFQSSLNESVQSYRLAQAGLDKAVVDKVVARVPVRSLGLYKKSSDGKINKADETGSDLARMMPLGLLLLMFMSVMIAAQPMLQSVIEEKQQRIAEVLLGSATPFQLMMGKLLGNVAVSLTILGIYMAGIYFTAARYEYTSILPMHLIGWFLVYDVLAVLLFGSVFVAIGAACNELKEAQNYLLPATVIMIAPMMVWLEVVRAPMSPFSTVASLIPPATPMLMLVRMSATDAVPFWQPALGVALVLTSVLICVFAAGRVFRIGLLAQGKAPKFTELLRWVVRG